MENDMSRLLKTMISVAILIIFVATTLYYRPRIKEYIEARKRAEPIIAMLRQGTSIDTIGNAVNMITGHRFVTDTNTVTGEVSHYVMEKLPDFEPLSRTAAEMVQKEIIRVLPGVSGVDELHTLIESLTSFKEQGTLAVRETDWKVVIEATDRYNSQMPPKSPFGLFVSTDKDGNKYVNGGQLDEHRRPYAHRKP